MPSVSLERIEGEGVYIQVRGTEPRQTNVTIDGVTMGPSGSLDAHELPMTDQPTRDVQLTVGDRSSKVTLQAGHTNPIDYLKMGQGSAP